MPLKKELIYIDGKNRTDDIVAYRFYGTGFIKNNCAIKFKNSTKEYPYNANKIKIVKSAINSEKASNLFQYLNQIAANFGLTTEEGTNILADSYSKITFIPEYSILANFLNGLQPTTNNFSKPIRIFPFGFNLSQKDALNKAFNSPLSVIEGPPGTGKTQTILNIIANAVMNGQSVAVVSSNNSATKNVYEKLQKNGIEFIAALLGNSTNKQEFIDSQTDTPDLAQFNLSDEEKTNIKQTSENLFNQLTDYLQQKNELALLKQELDSLTTEYKHFQDENKIENDVDFFKSTTADNILALWVALDNLALTNKKLTWWRKFLYWFRYGRNEKTLFDIHTAKRIMKLQSK